MSIGKIKDLTVKEAPKPSRWSQYDAPQVPQAAAPSAPVVNEKYRAAAATQQAAEDNVSRALAGQPAEIAGEVTRRAVADPYFTVEERNGQDADAKAYRFHLAKVRKELGL